MDIKFKLEADTNNFDQSIEKAIGEIEKLSNKMDASRSDIAKAFRELGKQSFEIGGAKVVDYFAEKVKESVVQVKDLEAELAKMKQSEGFDANSKQAKRLQESIAVAKQELQQYKSALEGADAAKLAKAQERVKGLKAAFDVLPAPVKKAVNGIKSLITAAKLFITTPLGMAVAALAAAFGALRTYFTGSAEGQVKMAKSTAVLKSVFDSLKDVVIAVGKAISKAFDDPIQTVKNLGNAILKNLMTRLDGLVEEFNALGKMVKALFSRDWDTLKEGAQDFGKAATKVLTGASVEQLSEGLGKAANKMKDFVDKTAEAAQQMGLLKQRELDLRQARSKWQAKEAELDEKIAKSRMAAYDEDATAEERTKSLEEAQTLITEKYQQQIAFAKEELAITKKKNSLHENTIEYYEKEDELQANINRLQAQMASEIASIERRRASAAKQAKEQEFQRAQEQLSLEVQIGEKRLEMQDESLEKQMEQIRLAKERQKIELKAQEHEWKTKQGGNLTKDQEEYIETVSKLIEESAEAETQKAIFDKYASAAAKALKEQKAFDKDINYLESQGKDTSEAVRQQQNAALDYLTSDEAPVNQEFNRWIKSLVEYTADSLQTMLLDAEKELKELEKTDGVSEEKLIEARARVAALNKEIKTALKDDARSPRIQKFQQLNNVLADSAKGFEALGETGNEAFDKIMKRVSEVLSSAQNVVESIQRYVQVSIEAEKNAADEGAQAVKTVEKASVILAIIGVVLQLAMKLKNMIEDTGDLTGELTRQANNLRKELANVKREMAIDVDNNTIFGDNVAKNLAQYTSAMQTYSAQYQSAVDKMAKAGIAAMLAMDHEGHQVMSENEAYDFIDSFFNIEGIKAYGNSLNEAINTMLDTTEIKTRDSGWFGLRKAKYDSLRNVLGDIDIIGDSDEETIKNLKALLETEESLPPKTKEIIEEMIADWDTYNEALEGVKSTLANFFNGMSDAFADSIKTGFEEGAGAGRKSFAQAVNGMVSDFYLQMKLGQRLAEKQEEYTQAMLEAEGADAKQDVVLKYADELMDMYDEELEGYNELQERLEARGYGLKDAMDGTLSGAIKGASQESIDLLSGYCNAVRIQQVDGINIMRDQLISLSGIERNTGNINMAVNAFRSDFMRMMESDSVRATGAVA